MGVVYRALDPAIGRTVAIKTIRFADLVDPSERTRLRDRLFREAQSAGILSHPNIVTIYDVSEEDGVAYIAMEYVDGPTLESLLRTSPPDSTQIFSILRETAAALDYAHKRGIVHRDIKPANIMLQDGVVAKIADFGVAKIQSQQMTHSGTIMGTPNYMSPEQVQGMHVDGKADQFSLAVIAYELLTGEKPFSGDSMPTLLYKIVREVPVPPQRLNPSLGWPVQTVLERALSKASEQRYWTCADFVKALENACASSKGWKPMAPGSSESLPTVLENGAARSQARGAPAAAIAPEPEPPFSPPIPPEESMREPGYVETPKLLRFARTLATLVVIGGGVSFLMVSGYRYFTEKNQPVEVIPQSSEPPAVFPPRPSPTGGGATAKQDASAAKQTETSPPPLMVDPLEKKPAGEEAPAREIEPRRETTPAEPGARAARVVTNPPGAQVVVDGKPELACTTPCSVELPMGRHTLATTMNGYRRAQRIFNLPAEAEVFINLEKAAGTLMIKSDPPGGTILIDGQPRGEKTPAMILVPTGSHRIEVQMQGFRNYVEDMEVKDSAITNIDVNWSSPKQ